MPQSTQALLTQAMHPKPWSPEEKQSCHGINSAAYSAISGLGYASENYHNQVFRISMFSD